MTEPINVFASILLSSKKDPEKGSIVSLLTRLCNLIVYVETPSHVFVQGSFTCIWLITLGENIDVVQVL